MTAATTIGPIYESGRSRSAPARTPSKLLESKLRAPQVRSGPLRREALVRVMDRSRGTPLVCLSAGPGWGKTTLLAQWASRSDRPFAWVSIDEKDNDPVVLLSYIAAALDRVSPLEASVFDALASPGVSVEGTVVQRLGAALAHMDEPVVLALDDLHLIDNVRCIDAVAALVRHVSDGSQVAVSMRDTRLLPLGALRARGLVLEIGANDLRMDESEARQLLSASGVEIPDEQIAELTERTEGWSAGLYLAALSIRARSSEAKSASFSGTNRFVSEYLKSELLANMSTDELRFLTRSAVLEELSGPLCDAGLKQQGSAATLEALERSNLFLVPLDGDGEQYRYHHLFRDLLRSELTRTDPDLPGRLLTRATDWCVANGQPETAIGYAQQAGDVDRVAELVLLCTQPAYQGGRVATVERWFDWLEAQAALGRNAAVAVLAAALAAVGGRPAHAERWCEVARDAAPTGALPDGSASSDAWLAFLDALLCKRGVAAMRADAQRAVELIPRGSQFRPSALVMVGLSRWLQGDLDEADDLFAQAGAEGDEVGAPEPAVVAFAERAMLAVARAAWVEAEELAERSLSLVRDAHLDEYPTSAASYAVAARIALHRGDAARGQELLGHAHRLRPRLTHALPHFSIQVRLELARAYLSSADAGGARTLLREADALLRRQPDLGTLPSQVEELRGSLETMHVEAPGASTLTTAELRLLPYLGTHLSFREIGQRIYLSPHTVKSQAIAIYRKLSVNSRTAAVERAREFGLL